MNYGSQVRQQPTNHVAEHRIWIGRIVGNIADIHDLVGLKEVVRLCLTALFTRNHILLEGNPGLAKTKLAKAICSELGFDEQLHFRRIQFTPDKLPTDLIGTDMPNGSTSEWEFRYGPIFTWLLLADEINRATPKTQAALLEVMAEQQITKTDGTSEPPAKNGEKEIAARTLSFEDGLKRPVEAPFFIIATQNPIDQEGTYDLPEAQSDRFLFKINMPFPDREDLGKILHLTAGDSAQQNKDRLAGKNLNDRPGTDELKINLSMYVEIAGERSKDANAAYRNYNELQQQGSNDIAIVEEHIINLMQASAMKDDFSRVMQASKLRDEFASADPSGLNDKRLLRELEQRLKTNDYQQTNYQQLADSVVDFPKLVEFVAQNIEYGLGPRAGIGLLTAVKAYSYLFAPDEGGEDGWPYEVLQRVLHPTLRHRLKLSDNIRLGSSAPADELITKLYKLTAPKGNKNYLTIANQPFAPLA